LWLSTFRCVWQKYIQLRLVKKTCWSATEAKWEDKLIWPEVNIARTPGDEQLIKLLKKRYPLPEYMRNQYISQK
jgi:hypothetical protein